MSSTRKITLKSCDGEAFEVDEAVALKSQTIKHMIEDDCSDGMIPVPNVTGEILAKVIEYCKKHVEAANPEELTSDDDLKSWDADFVKVDQATLSDLILAANYLNIESLLDLTVQTAGDMIKGKTPDELGKIFNTDELTYEEDEEVRLENPWAFYGIITLESSDGKAFAVDKAVALKSQTIKHMIEDKCVDFIIPVPYVTGKILAKVIEYCKKHVEAANPEEKASEEDLKAWDADFVKVDQATLFDLILAAHYLNIGSLLDLTCQTAGDMIEGMTPDEIRKFFNKNELTPEERGVSSSGKPMGI